MGHYAKILNGVVTQVIAADEEFFKTFIDTSPGTWIQTSYNTVGGVHFSNTGVPDSGVPLRKNYAGVGFTYDEVNDAFIPPKPHSSWVIDKGTFLWIPPIPRPVGDVLHNWDEGTQSWVVVDSTS